MIRYFYEIKEPTVFIFTEDIHLKIKFIILQLALTWHFTKI